MNATTVPKSAAVNRWEGILLTALVAFPTFSGSALLLELFGARIMGGPITFVLIACMALGLTTAWLGLKYPKAFKNYEPLFFDPTLYLEQKIQGWLDKPGTAKQLLTNAIMLAVLAIAVVTVG